MKKNLFYSITCVMLLIVLASCKKNFLDRNPQTAVPPDLFFNSEQDLALYINGLLTLPGREESYLGDQNTDDKATTGPRF